MTILSAVASVFSGLIAAVGWISQHVRSLSMAPRSWRCLRCGIPNELDRDTCWSCGEGYGEDPLFPSHIPFDRRWLCPSCAVWNGIARTDCWRCGTVHDGGVTARKVSGDPEPLPGNPSPGAPSASTPRAPQRNAGAPAWKRRNS